MHSRFSLCVVGGVLALALSALPAAAHHGWAGNAAEHVEVSGTVESGVNLSGPHGTMKLRANDQIWEITLAPPARTERAGLTEGLIPVGATITVTGHRSRDAKRFEIKTERVTWNGRTFDVYPDRD